MSSRELGKFARPPIDQSENPPPTEIRFFYASSASIDDPQAPVPPPTAQTTASTIFPLRPFSEFDNAALNQAWNKLRLNIQKYKEEKHAAHTKAAGARSRASSSTLYPSTLGVKTSSGGGEGYRETRNGQHTWPMPPNIEVSRASRSRQGSVSADESSIHQRSPNNSRPPSRLRESTVYGVTESEEQGLTGTPFARAPSRSKVPTSRQRQPTNLEDEHSLPDEGKRDAMKGNDADEPSTEIPVGISKLHKVTMPRLQLEPIYWKPVNDISAVIRATWFYKDTMLPVEADIANMLELGYLDLRPWSGTWQDELNSAIEIGAAGEEKIAHFLWPENPPARRNSTESAAVSMTAVLNEEEDTPQSRRRRILEATSQLIEASTVGQDVDNKASGGFTLDVEGHKQLYPGSQIIYTNERDAYILRPSLAPSSYYGRRPLANYIKKGHKLGIAVQRGFDQKAWIKLYPESIQAKTTLMPTGLPTFERGTFRTIGPDPTSNLSQATGGQVTDLILVIHGIGQKMAERVESFHFTHAMNAFRRDMNAEIGSPQVRNHLRKDIGGVMVLPVNWRSTLSFEDGGYREGDGDQSQNQYTLKDITPDSLSSVRSVINDVCFDIPYYLDTKYGPKMTTAVISEANRIYRLWCKNNPGFEKSGRVHIIAHSLGSIMAVDILSRQPTSIDPDLDSDPGKAEKEGIEQHFAFDTKNLYVCGSPVGFFLLLKSATLLPRRGRNKPSAPDDTTAGLTGSQDDYGCLAVDNIYNVINPYDPIAYRLNATLDVDYSSSLKTAFVPSASKSWLDLSNPFRSSPKPPQDSNIPNTNSTMKPSLTARLPSSVELETHNFTREEIAEKRAYLLNDNGQIDFFLKYGGGPLDIQYLTMLGAHSSYWLSRDFVRFIVVETGRLPGRQGTLSSMRARKKRSHT